MRLNQLTQSLCRKPLLALTLVFLSALIPCLGDILHWNGLVNLLSALTLGSIGILFAIMLTLQQGPKLGAIYTLAATLPYALVYYYANPHHADHFGMVIGVVGAVAVNALTYLWAVMLTKGWRWSDLIQVAALAALLLISVLHLVYPNIPEWWSQQIQTSAVQASHSAKLTSDQLSQLNDASHSISDVAKNFVTGLIMTALLFASFVQLIIANAWQHKVFANGTQPSELRKIRLSPLAGIAFGAGIILSFMNNNAVLDMMPVLYGLFIATGLSLVHFWFARMQSKTVWFWLCLFYLLLLIFFSGGLGIIALSTIAFLDIWFDLRTRLRKI